MTSRRRLSKEEILEHIRNGAGRVPPTPLQVQDDEEHRAFQDAQSARQTREVEAYGFVLPESEPHTIGQPDTRDWLDLFREVSRLRVIAVEAHTALTKARGYVAGTHASLAGACGYDNVVLPDLQLIDKSLSDLWEVVTDVQADEMARKDAEKKEPK